MIEGLREVVPITQRPRGQKNSRVTSGVWRGPYTGSVKRTWLYALTAAGLIAAGTAAFSLGRILSPRPEFYGTGLQNPPELGAIVLQNVNRGRVTLADFDAPMLLVFFGYTRCPDVCPLTLARVAKVYRDLGEPEEVQLVMVTVDPAHDTPAIVQDYASSFHPDFVGLSGDQSEIGAAARTFFVGYQQVADNLFRHTDMVAVLDARRLMRYIYGQDRVVRLAQDIPALLAQRGF